RRPIRVTEADQSQDISAVLRNLPFRQTRAYSIGRLLLRSIHTLNSTRAHPTARRGSLRRGSTASPHSPKRRAPARLFRLKTTQHPSPKPPEQSAPQPPRP